MIEEIMPAAVACAEAFDDPPGAVLFPEEAALITRAAGKRRREFTTGRSCARTALGRLGVPAQPILTGERGAPRWPPGIVGSITHCDGYRAAAVARTHDAAAIGLDAEPNAALPRGVLDFVSLPAERARLAALTTPGVCWDRLLFCAKECVYKAWFPLTGRWLGFEEADVTIGPDGTFTARLRPVTRETPAAFEGRWLAAGGLLLTAVTVAGETSELPRPGRPASPGAPAFARLSWGSWCNIAAR